MTIDTGRVGSADQALVASDGAARVSTLSGFDPSRWRECPFDGRLARTPYLVLPKLAIQVMPIEWREALEALLVEMEDCGLKTPVYEVIPQGGEIRQKMCRDKDDWRCGEVVPVASIDDPWADYRHNQLAKVMALCPEFEPASGMETRQGGNAVPSQHHSRRRRGRVSRPQRFYTFELGLDWPLLIGVLIFILFAVALP